MLAGGALLMTLFWVFAFVAGVAWIILPFMLFGTKPLLRQLLDEQRMTNSLLQDQARTIERQRRNGAKEERPQ